MAGQKAIPIVIGVGDVKNKSLRVEDAIEPMQLMLQATFLALKDTNLPSSAQAQLQSSIDSIDVVATWTWNYHDLPGLLGEKLGAKLRHKLLGPHGGHSPGLLFDHAAHRISNGKCKVAVVTGGEALASLSACVAAKKMPPPGWSEQVPNAKTVSVSDVMNYGQTLGTAHSVGLPIHVYPMYENAFRAHRGQSVEQNDKESAQLYGEFARVAKKNPNAWGYGQPAATEDTIRTVTKKNRMICLPYPLLMNAFNTVNMAAACLLTNTEYARELGIPESQWIYPLSGAGTSDSDHFWLRPNYYSSPSIARSIDTAIELAHLKREQIDVFDFYSQVAFHCNHTNVLLTPASCFPIVPKLACTHLGLPIANSPKPITLIGGLTSFGGAGNNYSMHALTEMTRELRKGTQQYGLVLANGGVATHQHVIILSNTPRKHSSPYPDKDVLPEHLTDVPIPSVDERAEGEATIETYTVEFGRDGMPLRGYIVGRLSATKHRFLANHADESTLSELSDRTKEQIGRKGWVSNGEGGRNVFSFAIGPKL